MSDLWLPGMPTNGRVSQKVVRPFQKIGKEIKRMGFECGLNHDAKERTMQVRFTPTTPKTKQACIAAGGDGRGLEVAMTYAPDDKPGDVALACIEKGLEVLGEVMG